MPGELREFKFKLRHPGQNVFEFSVPAESGELTAHNNTAPVIVNAIRDRLRVLLVSGAPHMGERAWRNLLKSDPSIDLVHFTILRSPSSMDATPQRELSLIVFPVDELFERKIQDFDLIIFDRYYQYGLLMPQYFTNISNFVKNGGALLLANSTDENDGAVFSTAIAELLPVARREGSGIMREAYMPALTEEGKRHPATSELARRYLGRKWGQWHSQSDFNRTRGEVLMTGVDGKPLLVIDKVEEGRVAVLASDDIWMWSKGGKQAGPYTEMLRSVSHWLMKEPELEEDFIKAESSGRAITVSQRETQGLPKTVTMKKPSGAESEVALNIRDSGWVRAELTADESGVYSFTSGDRKAFVVVGTADNPEFSDVHTTEEKLKPLVDETKGAVIWYQDERDFSLRSVSANARRFGDDDWIGIRRNEAYTVTNVSSNALIPAGGALFLILGGAILMWRREGGSR